MSFTNAMYLRPLMLTKNAIQIFTIRSIKECTLTCLPMRYLFVNEIFWKILLITIAFKREREKKSEREPWFQIFNGQVKFADLNNF